MTELSKLFTEIKDVDTSKLKICYITQDESLSTPSSSNKNYSKDIPIFWALYEDKLLYAICEDYRLGLFESFYDWENQDGSFFNFLEPTKKELSKILQLVMQEPKYFIVKPEVFLEKDIRDSICQWEMDIITKWNRDTKINKLLNE
jgi:hypothetical protein